MVTRFSPFLLLVFLTLTILLTSCAVPKELEYRDFKNFGVNKVSFGATTIRMDLVYYNPNNFGLQLQRTDLDIFMNDNYLGHTVQEQQITIPKRAEFFVPVTIDVDMKNLLKNGLIGLLSSEVMVKVTGSVKVGKANVFRSFPVNYEGKQSFSSF